MFKKLTPAILDATTTVWKEQLEKSEEEFSPVGYLETLAFDETSAPDMYSYCVEEDGYARAIARITNTKKPSYPVLKILQVRFEPRLDFRNPETESENFMTRQEEVINLYSEVMYEAIKLAVEENHIDTMKIYCEHRSDLNILSQVAKDLRDKYADEHGFTVGFHKNWIQFKLS